MQVLKNPNRNVTLLLLSCFIGTWHLECVNPLKIPLAPRSPAREGAYVGSCWWVSLLGADPIPRHERVSLFESGVCVALSSVRKSKICVNS